MTLTVLLTGIIWRNPNEERKRVLKSIGYKSVPVEGLPVDHEKGPGEKIDSEERRLGKLEKEA
ncbi:hypothetical protein NC653_038519 [Populus alba x Populus x berolinensis]|uniref:Uncharacterized protein n=1 Tax=Populus alba x Populus x berolinensis TaxID=444605 RepID=A0AAD6LH60_9ROSI|nr:hypothetical protein NC653_038519 [Populus alba x Populus x berolinensis]